MKILKNLLEQNSKWAIAKTAQDTDFFNKLAKQQEPEYLWIGCSDSRVPANQILDLPPGEIFVHRNIGNIVVQTDMNCLSVIQYAVEVLKIKHIIVCGHYDCGGVKAAVENLVHGLIDNWLCYIKDVNRLNKKILDKLDRHQQLDLLCELNVVEQVQNVCRTPFVQNAWDKGDKLSVYGLIYHIENGILRDLNACFSSNKELESNYESTKMSINNNFLNKIQD